ncbi:hypothetical protein BGX30_008814, partial [Mortierella sp. GBA39]
SPKNVSMTSTTITSSQSSPTLGPSQQTSSPTSNPNADGHPPLTRTRIPRNRGRFSFKERTRKIVHDPPPKAKQFVLKFYKERPESNPAAAKKSKPRVDKGPSELQKKSLAEMDKNGLMQSLSWHHPTSSLEIGTMRANVGRVVMDEKIQQDVIDCLQEAPRLAAGVKREAQRLIGHFVETLRNRMDQAEEDKRREMLLKVPLETMSEADRLQARTGAVAEVERNILS